MANSLTLCILLDTNGFPLQDTVGQYLTDPFCSNPYADQIADSIDRTGTYILQGVTHDERLQRMFGILFGTALVTSQAQADLLGIRLRGSTPTYYNPAWGTNF